MKRLNVILTLIISSTLIGCGIAEDLSRTCGGDMDQFCDLVLGKDPDKIKDLEQEVRSSNQLIARNLDQVAHLEEFLLNQILVIIALEAAFPDLANIEDLIESLELQVRAILAELAVLTEEQDGITVSAYIDPCGDSKYFDEILLQMSDGTILAYVEDKGHRFLAKLQEGSYRTTDKQRCEFKVVEGGVTWEVEND